MKKLTPTAFNIIGLSLMAALAGYMWVWRRE